MKQDKSRILKNNMGLLGKGLLYFLSQLETFLFIERDLFNKFTALMKIQGNFLINFKSLKNKIGPFENIPLRPGVFPEEQ